MPKMGESIMEGTIIEWRKKPGDSIEKDEILLEIGTDKVDSEIPSSHGGIITELLAKPNDIIEVGKIIARIETDGDSGVLKIEEPKDKTTDKEEPLPEKVEVKEKGKILEKKDKPVERKKFFTPVVLKIAREEGISLSILESLDGTGKGGTGKKQRDTTMVKRVCGKIKRQPSL